MWLLLDPDLDPAILLSAFIGVVGCNRVTGAKAGNNSCFEATLLELVRNYSGAISG
jgi:hypothetical protein